MARNFDSTNPDLITLGDLAGAKFDKDDTWSVLGFFRIENSAGDDRAIVSKWGVTEVRQFLMATAGGTAPVPLALDMAAANRVTGGNNVELNTWYLGAAICNGIGSGGLRMILLGMDGTVLDNATGDAVDPTTQTAVIEIGVKGATGDPMEGDIAHVAYFNITFSLQDVKDYLRAPARTVARHAGNAVFYLPLIGVSPEPDFSPNTNTGTVTGTTVGEGPPIGPLFGYGTDRGFTVAAPVGGANPRGPLGHPLHGALAGPIAA